MLFARLKNAGRLVRDREYRRRWVALRRLRATPRYTPGTTDLLGPAVAYTDAASLVSMYHDIFVQQIYRFRPDSPTPRIIDGGANIGLSAAYFKRTWPGCTVLAFEPDPVVSDVLGRNVAALGLSGVRLERKALWTTAGPLDFASEGTDSGSLVNRVDRSRSAVVEGVRLADYLDEPVDLLKLDIEGAETEVLADCESRLGNVRHLFVEYHSFAGRPQALDRLLGILGRAGFRVHVQAPLSSPSPFYERATYHGMDLQLNVFAWRDDGEAGGGAAAAPAAGRPGAGR